MNYRAVLIEATTTLVDGGKPEVMSRLVEERIRSLEKDGWQIVSVAPVSFGEPDPALNTPLVRTSAPMPFTHTLVATSFLVVCAQ